CSANRYTWVPGVLWKLKIYPAISECVWFEFPDIGCLIHLFPIRFSNDRHCGWIGARKVEIRPVVFKAGTKPELFVSSPVVTLRDERFLKIGLLNRFSFLPFDEIPRRCFVCPSLVLPCP